MEQPKARLTLQQHQQAINEAIWIDASPHEWPTVDKMWLLCSALIDSVQMVDYLRSRLAAVEAERDAARAGEARAVETLRAVVAGAYPLDNQPSALDWLAQQRREAAAEALENVRIGWLSDNDYRPGVPEIWRYIANRAAALRAGEVGNE